MLAVGRMHYHHSAHHRPSIAVPASKAARCEENGFVASSIFVLPVSRISDDVLPVAAFTSANRAPTLQVEAWYSFDAVDLLWLQMFTTQNRSCAALTVDAAELLITALEVASHANPQLPLARVSCPAAIKQDLESMHVTDKIIESVKHYWIEKRNHVGAPLITTLSGWVDEEGAPPDTPFLCRGSDPDVWVRTSPIATDMDDAQRSEAVDGIRAYLKDAVSLACELVQRETMKLDYSRALVYELAVIRAAASRSDDGDETPFLQHDESLSDIVSPETAANVLKHFPPS